MKKLLSIVFSMFLMCSLLVGCSSVKNGIRNILGSSNGDEKSAEAQISELAKSYKKQEVTSREGQPQGTINPVHKAVQDSETVPSTPSSKVPSASVQPQIDMNNINDWDKPLALGSNPMPTSDRLDSKAVPVNPNDPNGCKVMYNFFNGNARVPRVWMYKAHGTEMYDMLLLSDKFKVLRVRCQTNPTIDQRLQGEVGVWQYYKDNPRTRDLAVAIGVIK